MKLELGVHHVSLNVADLEKSLAFYVDQLGLEVLPRPDFGFPGAWLRAGPQEVHLMEVQDHVAPQGQHFAFRVSDLDQTLEALQAEGIEVSKVFDLPNGRQAFMHDPSGNMLELNEPKTT